MSKPIKVLILIDHLGAGGAQEFVYQLCRHISPDETRLSVCALGSRGIYKEKIEALGVPVYLLSPDQDLDPSPRGLIRLLKGSTKLWSLLRLHGYDVVHSFLQLAFAFGTPVARLAGIPTVHSIMAVRAQLQPWYFRLLGRYQRWVDLYITPIPIELTEAGVRKHKIKLVEVTVDVSEMLTIQHDVQLAIEPFNLMDTYPVTLSVGRLHPAKGHEYAILAWPHVLKKWPRARLLIVGDGEDEARLRRLADHPGLCDSIAFAGYRTDLTALFSRADIFLRTSINEGVNLTTIQAMAAGLPVIGFQNPAPKEIINNGLSGLLVPLGDELALAKAIHQLSEDRSLKRKLGQEGRARVDSYYDIASVVSFYEELYNAIHIRRPLDEVPDFSTFINSFKDHFSARSSRAKVIDGSDR